MVGLVSKATNPEGTFDGEEFPLYQELFAGRRISLSIIDVGANYGYWAKTFSEILPEHELRIECIEPIPHFYDAIVEMGISKVRSHNLGISKNEREIRVARVGGGGTSFPDESSTKSVNWIRVPAMTGDLFVNRLSLKPNLIKIDTDGFDLDVLTSFKDTLQSTRPFVQFEYTFRFARRANYTLKSVIEFLEKYNYKTYVITSDSTLRKIISPRLEVLNHQTKNFFAVPAHFARHPEQAPRTLF
jgi:FkbM family methyltransferase